MPRRNDLALYEREATHWWHADGRFAASLHALTRLRLLEVRTRLGARRRGLLVADLGCGGGLMAEPLARDGAVVVGCDLGTRTLAAARAHARTVAGALWVRADARRVPLPDGCAGLVLLADVLEHVREWRTVVAEAARLLAPGGLAYCSTVNRTWLARLLGVHLAEGLRLVPPGTHDPALFIRPQELAAAGRAAGLRAGPPLGRRLQPLRTLATRRVQLVAGASCALEYALWLERPD